MKKYLVPMMMALVAAVLLGGCATSEERAAQKAEQVKKVAAALNERQYKIAIARMYPMNEDGVVWLFGGGEERLAILVSSVFRQGL